jgi:hypothetical protein
VNPEQNNLGYFVGDFNCYLTVPAKMAVNILGDLHKHRSIATTTAKVASLAKMPASSAPLDVPPNWQCEHSHSGSRIRHGIPHNDFHLTENDFATTNVTKAARQLIHPS